MVASDFPRKYKNGQSSHQISCQIIPLGLHLAAEDEEEAGLELSADDEENWLPDKLLVSPCDDTSDPLCWYIILERLPNHWRRAIGIIMGLKSTYTKLSEVSVYCVSLSFT